MINDDSDLFCTHDGTYYENHFPGLNRENIPSNRIPLWHLSCLITVDASTLIIISPRRFIEMTNWRISLPFLRRIYESRQ